MRVFTFAVTGLILAATTVSAQQATSNAPQLSVVAVLGKTNQALVMDRNRGEYVVVKGGDVIQGFQVVSIDAFQVVLKKPGANQSFVVPNLQSIGAKKTARKPVFTAKPTSRVPAVPTVAKPTKGPGVTPPLTLTDPYPTSAHAKRPLDPYPKSARPVAKSKAPKSKAPKSKAPKSKVLKTTTRLPPTVVGSHKSQTQRKQYTLVRAEFDQALGDFHRLSKQIQVKWTKRGLRILTIGPGSYLHRLGLRKGDVVQAVAGQRLSSADDGATAFARVMSQNTFTVKVIRNRTKLTIHYTFDK